MTHTDTAVTTTNALVDRLVAHRIPAEWMPAFGPFEILVPMHDSDEVEISSRDNGQTWRIRLMMVDTPSTLIAEGLAADEVAGRFLAEFDDMFDLVDEEA